MNLVFDRSATTSADLGHALYKAWFFDAGTNSGGVGDLDSYGYRAVVV